VSVGTDHEIALGRGTDTRHKSAGLALLLSLILPGAGQLYCGKSFRGGVTLCFSLVGAVLCFMRRQPNLQGTGVLLVVVLWVFSFLDAYFTATEINSAQDAQVDAQNPRVAVTLNLLTAGFGYFYLGERAKGMAFFVGTQIVRFGVPRMTGYKGGLVAVVLLVVQVTMGVDAYFIARRQLTEALGPAPEQPVPITASRVPAFVPIGLAGIVGAGFFMAMIVGLAFQAARGREDNLAVQNRLQSRRGVIGSQSGSVLPATDFLSAVEEIRRVERKTHRTKDDLQDLKRDAQIIASELQKQKLTPDDAAVAHFYKAQAFNLINSIHEHKGEEVEVDVAKEAVSEFDKVIASNPHTYIPAVNVSNAEYYAGLITRNHLRSIPLAYEYWEKCAWQGHAGCLNLLANARFTGDGGEKMDINEALDLHTMVFNTGIQYRCAAASSALSIAKIVHFTGVHRAGDDELEWVNKSYSMMDKLGIAENNENVCDRAEAEIEEFLFRLSRGQRKPSILQDAAARLDGDSTTLNAVIQMFSGSASEAQFEAQVQSGHREHNRCTAYFDAMWYAHLTKQDAAARHYRERMLEIGNVHCGLALAYASKLNL
jgi:TM2 domain-containing membrane protein YozV